MDFFELSKVPIEIIYQEIGNLIVQAISADDWDKATVYVEIDDDDNGITYGRYTNKKTSNNLLTFETDYRMYLAFDELRSRIRRPGDVPWSRAEFVLYPSSKFNINFKYPDQVTSE